MLGQKRVDMDPLGKVEVQATETGVKVHKGRVPLWPGLLIVPLAFLAPIVVLAMWAASVGIMIAPPKDGDMPFWGKSMVALLFFVAGVGGVWVSYKLILAIVPVRASVNTTGSQFECTRYLAGIRTRRALLAGDASVIVQVYENSQSPPSFRVVLRDHARTTFPLTILMSEETSVKATETRGRKIGRPVAKHLKIKCETEYPKRS